MVPVVDHLAERKELAGAHEVVELRDALLGVLAAAAVQVAVEDARVAVGAEEDERVRERLEPRRDPVLQRLADLRVVVVDERDGVNGAALHERAVKHLAEVVVLGSVAGLLEVALEGRVKARKLRAEAVDVRGERVDRI